MIYQELVEKLLNLFHAAAQSDDEVHLLEVSLILETIQEKLPKLFPDLPEEYKNLIITQGIEYYKKLYKKDIPFESSYSEFLHFYQKNKEKFSSDLRDFCIETTLSVLDSHAGINEAEKNFIKRLRADCK